MLLSKHTPLCEQVEKKTKNTQGSIIGPVLYAIIVSPFCDLQSLINFADDNFCVVWSKDLVLLGNPV